MKVAILYQHKPAPEIDGIIKPMKEGGYADSGADIAYSLKNDLVGVATPVTNPSPSNDLDWVFPDSQEGICRAISAGADTFWLNTVLYKNHPIESAIMKGYWVVGQDPRTVQTFDDKITANNLLHSNGLPVPRHKLIDKKNYRTTEFRIIFPAVVKPVRGRGSQGVVLVNNETELLNTLDSIFESKNYGDMVYVEEFLSGEELTVSVMPPGQYLVAGKEITKKDFWALPPVKRINHSNGIAPYNGIVAVTQNSLVLTDKESDDTKVAYALHCCESAAKIVGAKSVIRIDCRANENGDFFLFDLNMKPNMTGASRPNREDQDSLTAIAARKLGWSFGDFLTNMLAQRWHQ
jgi:D-alanine-D-alanine ligase-like ATP-grasp enzyme